VRQGNGRFTSSVGDVYEGEWSQDHMHGLGTYTDHMGWSFTGTLSRGRPVSGIETCSDGTCFNVTYSLESDSQPIRSYQWFELPVPVSRVPSCDPRNSDIEGTPSPRHINLSNPEFSRGPFLNPATDHDGNITHYCRHEGASLLDFQRDGVFLGNFTPRDLYHEMVQSMVCPDVNDVFDYPVPQSQPPIGVESVLENGSCLYHSVSHLLSQANTIGNPFHGANSSTLRHGVVSRIRTWSDLKLETYYGERSVFSVGTLPRINKRLDATDHLAMMSLFSTFSGIISVYMSDDCTCSVRVHFIYGYSYSYMYIKKRVLKDFR